MNKKTFFITFKKRIMWLFASLWALFLPIISRAQAGQISIDPSDPFTTADPSSFIEQLYQAGFAVVGAVAFFVVVFAGLEYIVSAGNVSRQQDAKDRMLSVVYGILLLFLAQILFNTINPAILNG